MIIEPKIDKLGFVIHKASLPKENFEDVQRFFERADIKYNSSPLYITVHLNPTKLQRPNFNYNYEKGLHHNLQMNTDLLIDFFEELKKYSLSPNILNIRNLHIAKDRVMGNSSDVYAEPLLSNACRYKGRIRAFEISNGTTPSVHICNDSNTMNRGEWLIKVYNKSAQLIDHLEEDEIIPLEPLSKEEIKMLGRGYSKYTGRINLNKVNLTRAELELKGKQLLQFPHVTNRLTVNDIITMVEDDTLTENLNKVFNERVKNAIFPEKKETTRESEQDRFNASSDMYRFDCLFMALDRYSAYKEYMNSIISNDDLLLQEMQEKFIEI